MPGSAYVRVRAFGQVVEDQRRSWRVGATMFVAFGALALIVAAVGLYGVIAYNVAQRMHELGVRIALGAQSRDVIRLVVSQGVRVVFIGLLIGGGFALYAGRWIEPLLFQLSAKDPGTYALVAGTAAGRRIAGEYHSRRSRHPGRSQRCLAIGIAKQLPWERMLPIPADAADRSVRHYGWWQGGSAPQAVFHKSTRARSTHRRSRHAGSDPLCPQVIRRIRSPGSCLLGPRFERKIRIARLRRCS